MIETLYKVFILSWLLTHFTPIKMIIDTIPMTKWKPIPSILISTITLPFLCLMCCCFWVGLIMTGDIYQAATASILGWLFTKVEQKIEWTNL